MNSLIEYFFLTAFIKTVGEKVSSLFESKEPTNAEIAAKKVDEVKETAQEKYQKIADEFIDACDKTVEAEENAEKNIERNKIM